MTPPMTKVTMKPIAQSQGLLRRRLGLAGPSGVLAAELAGIAGAIEERLLWERYGL